MKNTILDEILILKKEEIARLNHNPGLNRFKELYDIEVDTPNLIGGIRFTGPFYQAIKPNKLNLIAEIKKASPTKGIIQKSFDPIDLAYQFINHGASALSVLTEKQYFMGSHYYIKLIKLNHEIPILRKDFIIDPIQIYETKWMGADALLLIKSLMDQTTCQYLINLSHLLKLDVFLEVHTESEITAAAELKGDFILGINNRDLTTFKVNSAHAQTLHKFASTQFKASQIYIAESGYSQTNELESLSASKFNGVLIGEGLTKNPKLLTYFDVKN